MRAEQFEIPRIAVYGRATTDVVPDQMRWQIGIRTTAKTISAVAKEHENRLAAMLAFLKREEIDEKKIQTSQLQLAENFGYQRDGKRIKEGYFASSRIVFESKTFAYPDLWKGISTLAGVSIQGVSFETSRRVETQEKTRILALKNAAHKASQMAKVLDASIGVPLLIEEDSSDSNRIPFFSNRIATKESDGRASISVGTISITIQVKVVFELKSQTSQ